MGTKGIGLIIKIWGEYGISCTMEDDDEDWSNAYLMCLGTYDISIHTLSVCISQQKKTGISMRGKLNRNNGINILNARS